MVMLPEQKVFFIGDWRVSPAEGVLSRDGEVVHLEPKVAEVLVYLAAHAGQVVTRQELEREVWQGALVGYDAITNTVIKLRRALHDNSHQPQYVTTIPKRGYELIAPVRYLQTETNPNPSITSTAEATAIAPVTGQAPKLRVKVILTALLGVLFLASTGAWLWFAYRSAIPRFQNNKPSLIVMPFKNLSHDASQDYLADGMTEDLITDLSRTARLQVLASNTSYIYHDKRVAPREVGKTLHIDYVLQGNIRTVGGTLRVNTQLVEARTGFNKWAESYDRSTQEIFNVRHEITSGVVNALALNLTAKEKQRLASKATSNLKAYGYFQEGQRLSKGRTKEDNQLAETAYRKAIAIDPTYGRAYGALAVTLGVDFFRGWTATPKENLDRALELARNAVALDDSIPQTYWALGWVYLMRREHAKAEQATMKSIEIAPNYADGYGLLAFIDNYQGKSAQAIAYLRKGMQLNPYYSWDYPYNLGRAYYDSGQYAKAVAALEQARQRNPNIMFANVYLVASYVRLGRQDDAEWVVQELQVMDPPVTISHISKVAPYSDLKLLQPLLADLRKAGLPE
ncbi:MAG: winged helix-turn-helix domain-containing protein [Gammaproteobacteria bacterium]